MATVPAGMTAGSPVNGVIPLYSSTTGQIAGTMQGGQVIGLDSEANKSAAYAFPNEIGVSGGAAGNTAVNTQSYLSPSGSNMASWNDITSAGYSPQDIATFQQHGWSPDQVMDSIQKGYAQPPSQQQATPQQNAFGITSKDSGKGYNTLTTASGKTINVDSAGNYFTTDAQGNNTPVTDQQAQSMGFQSQNPETLARQQLAQIDPTSEALRGNIGQSYLDIQNQAAQGPTAADYQKQLDLYKQVDPTGYAQRIAQGQGVAQGVSQAGDLVKQAQNYVTQVTGQAPKSPQDALDQYQKLDPQGFANMQALGSSENLGLKSATDQLALGSQLDPVSQMQVEQQARKAQADRGNLYGSGQAAVEAMTTGQAGQALLQQRQQAALNAQGGMQSYLTSGATQGAVGQAGYQQGLANQQGAYGLEGAALGQQQAALGAQQSYLTSGLDLGTTAMNMYQQQLANKYNANQAGLSYLSSGQTPYQAGASYLGQANATAANAAQGGPVYQPASLGAGNVGTAQQAPQYGLDVGNQSQNYFNSLNNAYGGGGVSTKNRAVGAGVGAASGAVSGAAAGAPLAGATYGMSIPIGAGIGALAGGASGYYS
jgi:hypothetical protein